MGCRWPPVNLPLCGTTAGDQNGSAQIIVSIDGVTASALLDSGSSVSLVTSRIVARCSQRPRRLQLVTLRSASNEVFTSGGACTLNICIDGRRVQHDFLVVDELVADLILGVDFLSSHGVQLDFALSTAGIPLVKLQWKAPLSELSVDRTVRPAMTPAAAHTDCYSAAIELDAAEELIADSAVPCFDSNIELVLPKCTAMYRELVQKCSRLFRKAPGFTDLAFHVIPTGEADTVRIPARRMPRHLRDNVMTQIQSMLN